MNPIVSKEIVQYTQSVVAREDHIVVEEPLEIRLRYHAARGVKRVVNIAVTMRTPGDDESLVRGFLFTEGLIASFEELVSTEIVSPNVILVEVAKSCSFDEGQLSRNFYATSSCGVCGKASIESIHSETIYLPWKSDFSISPDLLKTLPANLRAHQAAFDKTGGIHACALFDRSGIMIDFAEDVGRHNAMDKLIGNQSQMPLGDYMVLVSGRASFELVQKASKAGISMLAAIGAPSSLAIDLAKTQGMTLVGFLKNDRFNCYCGNERLTDMNS